MRQQNIDLVRGLYDAFARGDVPAVLSAFDENIEWSEAENFLYSDQNPYIGPQAVLEGVFMRIVSEWDDFAVTAQEFLGGDDHVVALGRYTGTFKQVGKSVDAQFAHVWNISDGKVVRFRQFTDTKAFSDAVRRDAG
jgi:uncharacterized protein